MSAAPGPRRTTAALLVVEAIAVTTPALALTGYVGGSQIIGTAAAHVPVPDIIGQGVTQALTPLTGLLLTMAAWGVWHAARGIGALLLQPVVVAFGLVAFLRPMTLIDALPFSVVLLTGLVVATVVLLAVIIAKGRPQGLDTRRRRWWWLAAYAAGVVTLAVVGTGHRSLPSNPTMWWADQGFGEAPPVVAPAAPAAPQNPGLAANPWNSIHNDSWASDAYSDQSGPTEPRTAQVDSLFTGGDCATITFDSRGRLITLCSSLSSVIAYVVDPTDLSVIHQEQVGSRTPDLTDFSGGGYFVLDNQDRIVFPAADGVLTVLDTADGITPAAAIPVGNTLTEGEKVTSVLPDWQGRYWYVGSRGTVGVVSTEGGEARAVNLSGESIENSFAVTRDAVFVVTGEAAYRLRASAGSAPVVAWRATYDAGTRQKPGQTSRASGTTPTVFAGGRLVAYTDNAEPRMQVVVADTRTGRRTCLHPVFAADRSATENSIIAVGDTLIVENNYGYRPAITATSGGHSTEPGLAAIDVDPDTGTCRTRWTNNDITIPSLVSKATVTGNLVLTYTKPANPWGVDAWYFTAVDLDTGAIAWQRLAGTGIPFNNHYAAGYLSPAGDMLVGTVNGLVALRNTSGG